jgi:hypothetical protein
MNPFKNFEVSPTRPLAAQAYHLGPPPSAARKALPSNAPLLHDPKSFAREHAFPYATGSVSFTPRAASLTER